MKNKVKEAFDLSYGKELSILPGNLAYSFVFAIIPILSLLFYTMTTFNLPVDVLQNFLTETFPEGIVNLLQPIFNDTMTLNSLIPMLIGIFAATNGCNAIIIASNTIYGFENAFYLKRLYKGLCMMLIMLILFAFILVVPLLGRPIINLFGITFEFIGNNQNIINILYFILQVPVSMLIMYIIIKLIYVIAPDEKIPSKYVKKGAMFTTVSWLLVTILYSYYINNIARYDLVYGNLANIVILLFWFYILAYIFVIGLRFNKKESDKGIEKTNTIKLEEINKKIKEEKNKK